MAEEYKRKNVRLLIAVGIAGVAVVLMALAGSLFGDTATETGLAPPGGGLFAGATVVPSDEEDGIVKGDGFTVTTEVLGAESKNYPGTAIAVISNVRIVKVRDAGNRGDFKVDFDVKWRTADTKVAYSDNIKNLYTKEAYYSHGSGNTFCVYQGKEIYLRIISSNQHEEALSGIYKVVYSGQS